MKLNRRTMIKSTALLSAGAMASFAGCSSPSLDNFKATSNTEIETEGGNTVVTVSGDVWAENVSGVESATLKISVLSDGNSIRETEKTVPMPKSDSSDPTEYSVSFVFKNSKNLGTITSRTTVIRARAFGENITK